MKQFVGILCYVMVAAAVGAVVAFPVMWLANHAFGWRLDWGRAFALWGLVALLPFPRNEGKS